MGTVHRPVLPVTYAPAAARIEKQHNWALKRPSHQLAPLMSSAIGKYGHDPYGYTPQSTMIPSLYDMGRLVQFPEGEDLWMLETKAVRDCNRVAETIADAIAIVEDLL